MEKKASENIKYYHNENGEIVFGMNDAGGVFPTWPGTLGIAAAVKGSGIEVADKWAEAVRRSWKACNLRNFGLSY